MIYNYITANTHDCDFALHITEVTTFLTSTVENSSSDYVTNVLTLRLSSILFAFNDSFALCSFASKEYQEGAHSPKLILKISAPPIETDPKVGVTNDSSKMTTLQGMHEKQAHIQKPAPASAMVTVVSNCEKPFSLTTEDVNSIESQKYQAGDVVSNGGKNYKCKTYPYTTWCNLEAYTPGDSSFWAMAWDLVGECRSVDQSIHKKDGEEKDGSNIITEMSETMKIPTAYSTSENASNNSDIVINGITNPCPLEWELNHEYSEFEKVTYRDTLTIYECKEWPLSALCSGEAYAVGKGPLFQDVWREVGQCIGGRAKLYQDETMNLDTVVLTNAENGHESMSTKVPDKKPTQYPTFLMFQETNELTTAPTPAPTYALKETKTPTNEPTPFPTFLMFSVDPTKAPSPFPTFLMVQDAPSSTGGPIRVPSNSPTVTPTLPPADVTQLEGITTSLDEQEPLTAQDLFDKECGPPFDLKATYSKYEVVSKDGLNFSCELPSWCGMPNFEPLDGKFWKAVWVLEGPCSDATQSEVNDNELSNGNAPEDSTSNFDSQQSTQEFKNKEHECPEAWILDNDYVEGDLVESQSQIYSCKPFPYDGKLN